MNSTQSPTLRDALAAVLDAGLPIGPGYVEIEAIARAALAAADAPIILDADHPEAARWYGMGYLDGTEQAARPAPIGAVAPALDDALSAVLWLYHRLPRGYDSQPHIERVIRSLANATCGDADTLLSELGREAAAPAAPTRKDHDVREFVNGLRDIAIRFHAAGQLRERIAYAVQDFLAIPAPAAPIAEVTDRMTEFKTNSVMKRGYQKVGYVLQMPGGDYCLSSQSAVRWLDQKQYWRLMHEQNGSLFAENPCDIGNGGDGIHDPHFCRTHQASFYGDKCPGKAPTKAPETAAEITPADRYDYLARQVQVQILDHDAGWSSSYSFPMIDRHSDSTYNDAKPFRHNTVDEAINAKIRVSRSKEKK